MPSDPSLDHLIARCLELCPDMPDPEAHRRYLQTLRPDQLIARHATLEAQAYRTPQSESEGVPTANRPRQRYAAASAP